MKNKEENINMNELGIDDVEYVVGGAAIATKKCKCGGEMVFIVNKGWVCKKCHAVQNSLFNDL